MFPVIFEQPDVSRVPDTCLGLIAARSHDEGYGSTPLRSPIASFRIFPPPGDLLQTRCSVESEEAMVWQTHPGAIRLAYALHGCVGWA